MGSSNFTMKGLGLGATSNNIELNLEVESSHDRCELKAWFDELWNNEELVEDVKQEVLVYLEQLYQNKDPQFIYYKTLFQVFEKFLAEQAQSGLSNDRSQLFDTEIWESLFEFQKDGVKGAINKIIKYNGCILADSAGLGKTYEALAVIKYFELRNERVLVLCPKKLRENWTVYQAQNNSQLNPLPNDRFSYTVLSHTDLSRDSGMSGDVNLATINWGNYDLVVIDESHNFRNNTKGKKDDEGNEIKKSRYEKLMDDIIKSGVKTKVLLLSATPVNNDLKDLRNPLYLIGRDDAFRDLLGIDIALVTGKDKKTTFGKNDFNEILTNFSPISKKRQPQEGEINLLIATDCISEGQNLQDCDYLINYDIHWNPVRIIQRFGRIDRIGSLNHSVQMVNFWPTDDLEKYLDLRNRVEARMALVDITATSEDSLLESNELEALIKDDLTYRDKQLLRLKDEMLDIEDFSESISLNEFTLDDFRIELTKYLESNRKQLQNAPLGLYAVVPTKPDSPTIAPGVIFCLKQKNDSPGSGNENINPLQPYFLIYVREKDREMRFSFAQPKQILEIYRLLCAERAAPYKELCNLFDQQTDNGADMNLYNDLLQRAIESIARRYKKRGLDHLLSSRSAVLPKQDHQVTDKTDFELITWLVIK